MIAFGDESYDDKAVVYSLVVIDPCYIQRLDAELRALKESFGAAGGAKIHCSEMLYGFARKKMAHWKHLPDSGKVLDLFDRIGALVEAYGFQVISAIWVRKKMPKEPLPGGIMWDAEGRAGGPMIRALKMESKQIGVFCAQAAILQYQHLNKSSEFDLVVDPDSSGIDWMFGRSSPINAIGSLGLDLGSGAEPAFTPKPRRPTDNERHFVDLADLVAFVTRRTNSFDPSISGKRLRNLRTRLSPIIAKTEIGFDGRLKFRVSNTASKNQSMRGEWKIG